MPAAEGKNGRRKSIEKDKVQKETPPKKRRRAGSPPLHFIETPSPERPVIPAAPEQPERSVTPPRQEAAAAAAAAAAVPAVTPFKTYPAPILVTPKTAASMKKTVKFNSVQVREYARLHNGSGGIPDEGAFPLGLGWEYEEPEDGTPKPLAVYEKERVPARSPIGVQPLSEAQRRAILERSDPTLAKTVQGARVEMARIRRSRSRSAGCSCSPKSRRCTTDACACHELRMPCVEGVCTCFGCCNPHRRAPDGSTLLFREGNPFDQFDDDEDEDIFSQF